MTSGNGFMEMLMGVNAQPYPAAPLPQSPGIGGFLSRLLTGPQNTGQFAQTAGNGPATGMNQPPVPDARAQAPTPSRGLFGNLLDPDVAFPTAATLMGQGGNAANFANAFGAMGQSLKRNQTMDYIAKKDPQLAELVQMGLEPKDAFGLLLEKEKAQLSGMGKPPQVETFYDEQGRSYKAQWDPQKRDWVQVGGAKGDEGFEVSLPDGTTVRQGAFGNQDRKNVANRINDEQEASKTAASLKQTVGMLRKANQNTGYSGPGAGLIGGIDDAAEQFGMGDYIPGNAGARATMRSGGLDVALAQVQKTKGSISNAEMQLFMAAAPGMQNTPQGNAAMLDILDAVADRQIQRTAEAEKWRQQYGTLDGFEQQWADYIRQNPLLAEDGVGGVRLANQAGGAADPLGIRK
ncbi:hypothetical protein [Mesorhizobium sp. ANAO-SY3R2]|uniref:hypothetical protein n=1 Tax=Mesorhizobium sp. ANAO-SY3R2 TaxID=3166644 RepID=UPI00366C96B0